MIKQIGIKKERVETLDWLRGLMALSIMFYHLSDFTITKEKPLDSSDFLGRLGIYGVSVFFVLSGLSMAIVYNNYIKNAQTTLIFLVRRIFRIWPLFWIVCGLKILFTSVIIKSAYYSFVIIFLNLTTLFGFVKPSAYIPLGAWSIGNEMVYYLFTPLLIYLFNKNKVAGNFTFAFTLIVGLFFSFFLLDYNVCLSKQWATYINPFNNFFLYVMGIAIYYNFKNLVIKQKLNLMLLFLSISLFCFLPFSGDLIYIVTGYGRIAFVILSFIIVLCFYKLKLKLPDFITKSLTSIGLVTYGLYLVHPIVYSYLVYFFEKFSINNSILVLISVPVTTFIACICSYKFLELKLMNIGKRITFKSFKSTVKAVSN